MTKIKEKEKEFIDSHYKGVSTSKMAKLLYEATGTKVNKSTIVEYYRRKGFKSGVNGRFQKGHVGLSEEKLNNIRRTQYKVGHKPLNHKPIGASYIRSDGYKYVKVAEHNWKTEQKLVWKEANGEIPDGYKILHLDGNSLNNNLDNLMLISNGESVTVNGYGLTKDADLNKAIVLTARLKYKLQEEKDGG